MHVGAIGVHHEHLVALVGFPSALKNEALAVRAPIGFRVLPAVRQLAEIGKVLRLGGSQAGESSGGKKRLIHA